MTWMFDPNLVGLKHHHLLYGSDTGFSSAVIHTFLFFQQGIIFKHITTRASTTGHCFLVVIAQ
jgi:hypothetical protein